MKLIFLLGALTFLTCVNSFSNGTLPYIEREIDGNSRLVVSGNRFVILGGEVMNSNSSTPESMQEIWPKLKRLNLNTVLLPVAWQQVEKQEGEFDFSVAGSLIDEARKLNFKLVLLWFGTWKNGSSGYAPHWVMRDTLRFPRMKNASGENRPYLSNLSKNVLEADKKAFNAFMNFIKSKDPNADVVIMCQIENEMGLLGDSRDRSEAAEKNFSEKVPSNLIAHIKKNEKNILPEIREAWINNGRKEDGTWTEIFGKQNALADEMFMAWNYATFVELLAKSGKQIHNIPMFVNAWTISPDNPPAGSYPSGGPNYRMLDVWQAAAPSIDFLAVDNYQDDYAAKCKQFYRSGNPLFVPESCALVENAHLTAPAKAFYTIGEFGSIGFSPFAIDYEYFAPGHPLERAYEVLSNLMPIILKSKAGVNMRGFMQHKQRADNLDFGDIQANVHYNYSYKGYGLIIRLSKEEFLVAGSGIDVHFESKNPNFKEISYGLLQEGRLENGKWKTLRYLGGDEAHNGGGLHMPSPYLKDDAHCGMISAIKAHVFFVKNPNCKNSDIEFKNK